MTCYAVVSFLDEQGTVDIVPSSWLMLNDSAVYWPPTKQFNPSQISRMVKDKHPLDVNWTLYKVKVLAKRESYDESRHCLKRAEYTSASELGSDSEVINTQRKRRLPDRFASDNDDDHDEMNQLPTLKRTKHSKNPKNKILPSRPSIPTFENSPPSPNLSDNVGPFLHSSTPNRDTLNTSEAVHEQPDEMTSISDADTTLLNNSNLTPERTISQRKKQSMSSATSSVTPFERHLLVSLEELHQTQKIVIAALQKVMTRLGTTYEAVELPSTIRLPISTMEQIDEVEKALTNDETKKILINYLAGVGGRNLEENVRRVLSKTIGSELATKFNWLGRGEKRGFHSLRLNEVILGFCTRWNPMAESEEGQTNSVKDLQARDGRRRFMMESRIDLAAVRKTTLENTTEEKIFGIIKDWFKYARDRCGGRRQREKKQ